MSKQLRIKKYLLKQYPAFSLVEIAVALVIIGFLVGAVLKGQDLLHSARLNTLISQINQYKVATNAFIDRYGALPGDFSHASTQISARLKDGNNSGVIQGRGAAPENTGEGYQATAFWSHLAAADLIPDPGTLKTSDLIGPDNGFPSTKLGGGITVAHNPASKLTGHWFVIGQHNGARTNGGLFSTKDALSVMQKLDTPSPTQGSVQVRNSSGRGSSHARCLKGDLLNIETEDKVCVLYVKF